MSKSFNNLFFLKETRLTLNPFVEQLQIAKQKASELVIDLQKIKQEIEWFEGVNINILFSQLNSLKSEIENQTSKNGRIKARILQIMGNIDFVSNSIYTLWNPINWFGATQAEYRAQARSLKDLLEKTKKQLSTSQTRLLDAKNLENVTKVKVEKYSNFNLATKNIEYSDLAMRLSSQKKQIEIIALKKQQIDTAIDPIVSQIRQVDMKITKAVGLKQSAQNFDNKLSSAQNSYDRAIVHQACEKMFGIGSPKKVISNVNQEIHQLERDREKLKTRARNAAKKAARNIQKLIIDGNNLCYQGDRFIGLNILKVLLPKLSESYDITVIFDSSIRRLVQSNDKEIRDLFGQNIKILDFPEYHRRLLASVS